MQETAEKRITFTDGSKLITESLVRAGADVFIGYPITPANLLYSYGKKRYPLFLSAPDEITTLQWMSGFAGAGKLPVTATSFPGYALMIESINMAYMMELPMIIILIQRLGPATGTATCGAQGDLNVINGTISGDYPLPAFSISNSTDCWTIPPIAAKMAVDLRTPVVILTSKEEVMTMFSFDLNSLPEIEPVKIQLYEGEKEFMPYKANDNKVPSFLPLGNNKFQVRLTASTHDEKGLISNTNKEALDNTRRLHSKIYNNFSDYLHYELDEEDEAHTMIITYGISSSAARDAVKIIRSRGRKVSLLVMKTIYPIPPEYFTFCKPYANLVIVEENLKGTLRHTMFGYREVSNISGVNVIGRLIKPSEIVEEVMRYE